MGQSLLFVSHSTARHLLAVWMWHGVLPLPDSHMSRLLPWSDLRLHHDCHGSKRSSADARRATASSRRSRQSLIPPWSPAKTDSATSETINCYFAYFCVIWCICFFNSTDF